jgi:hypothetical protein
LNLPRRVWTYCFDPPPLSIGERQIERHENIIARCGVPASQNFVTSRAWDINESVGPVTTDRHLDDVIVVESGSNVALWPLDTLIPLLSL